MNYGVSGYRQHLTAQVLFTNSKELAFPLIVLSLLKGAARFPFYLLTACLDGDMAAGWFVLLSE